VHPASGPGPLVAIDARLVGYAAGIARYTTLLIDALDALEGPERYLVLQGRRSAGWRPSSGHMRRRRMLTPPHHAQERWALALELAARPPWPSLLHSVDHVSPTWRAWRSVVTLHDLAFLLFPETHTHASRAYYSASGESVRRAERVIAVSQRTASDAVRLLGVDPARMRVVPEAASPAFRPRAEADFQALLARLSLNLAPQGYALFVGTLEPRKNVPLLLEAFGLVRRYLDVELVLVGARGWLDEPIFAAQARAGLETAAHFIGVLGEDELAVLYSHAGVFVLPSLYEGFGLPVLEAMACGAPVVSSSAGPLPEVAGDAAVLLPPEDAETWARTLLTVLTDRRQADELRRRGFARAATFSWQRAAQSTREVYREALLA
jgi:glycosyltransferase involved in cell wall biosynthesis